MFTPDAKPARDALEEDQWNWLGEADSEEIREALHAQRELLQNHPELLERLPNEMVAELL